MRFSPEILVRCNAGAGYDLSLAASDSKSLGQTISAGNNFNFGNVNGATGGNTFSGGQVDQTTRPTSAAEATNRSPGTTNTVSGDAAGLTPHQQYLQRSSQANTSVSMSKEATVGLVVLIALLAYAATKK